MVNKSYIEKVLQTYTLEEVMELNDLTDEDVLTSMIHYWRIELPVLPVDI